MITEEEYLKAVHTVEAYKLQKIGQDLDQLLSLFPKTIDEMGVSIRAKNILRKIAACNNHKDSSEYEVYMRENEMKDVIPEISVELMMKLRNCGDKTAKEIESEFLKRGYQIPLNAD